ncbi:MAG: hypothetical protein V2I33_18150 [Kangiellaceae bacterium]|nr:hypothetical protein [Kangiellaceae bacterium]
MCFTAEAGATVWINATLQLLLHKAREFPKVSSCVANSIFAFDSLSALIHCSLCDALSRHIVGFPAYSSSWVLNMVLCAERTAECETANCELCCSGQAHRIPSPEGEVRDFEVTFCLWEKSRDSQRIGKVMRTMTVLEAHGLLLEALITFVSHELTRRHQSHFFRAQKEGLDDSEVLVHFDFSENYSCAQQDATQAAYWSQRHVTIFTVGVYRQGEQNMLAIVSDTTDHSKVTVTVLLDLILQRFSLPGMKLHFWSDGPSSQFKNRFAQKYLAVACVKFQLKMMTWNFFATSHGKGAIDGIGGTLKRFVWRKVKARQVIVSNAKEFVDAAKPCGIECCYIAKTEVQQKFEALAADILSAPEVPGIKKQHFWCAAEDYDGVLAAKLSESCTAPVQPESAAAPPEPEPETHTESESARETEPQSTPFAVGDWVVVRYQGTVYPGQVTQLCEVAGGAAGEVKYRVNAMAPSGPQKFKWPRKKDQIFYSATDVLRKIEAPTPTGSRKTYEFDEL